MPSRITAALQSLAPLLGGHRQPVTRLGRMALHALGAAGAVYGAMQRLRVALYRDRQFSSYRPPCRVISVGNLTAGGTGKTPAVLWLARHLLATHCRASELAIVSRGYGTVAAPSHATWPHRRGRHKRAAITVVADPGGIHLAPPLAADEALLIARNLPGVTVLTGPDRARLIRFAVARHGVRWIVMDDGFQHLRVQRDLDLVLLDARHPFGNGHVLPGGLLREPPGALRRCDAILLTRATEPDVAHSTRKQLQRAMPYTPIFTADHRPSAWGTLGSARRYALSELAKKPVLAFCGIARPDSFAHLLAQLQTPVLAWHTLPDHHPFSKRDLATFIQQARVLGAHALVCTEKDAVKLSKPWLTTPDNAAMPLFFLCMTLHFHTQPTWLHERLSALAVHGLTPSMP